MIIYGAGMAGLLAANMLRRHQPVIIEAQPSLPNNHAALLRFRTDACSRATGIPFKRVRVSKAVCDLNGELRERSSLKLDNLYSQKVTGTVQPRSILNTEPSERFIAPPDYIPQMAKSVIVKYGSAVSEYNIVFRGTNEEPAISTLPMPVMMKMAGWKDVPEFKYRSAWSVTQELEKVDVYQTVYYPGDEPYYRASVTGNILILEYAEFPTTPNDDVHQVLTDFALHNRELIGLPPKPKEHKYGKISPLESDVGKRFVLFMTDKHRIYSLGRFATWRQLLQDDLVHDVEMIERLIEMRSGYAGALMTAPKL